MTPAPIEKGHPVSVYDIRVGRRILSRNVVRRAAGNGMPSACGRVLYVEEEGVTWCRGWKGPQVDLFRVACALATS